MSCPAFPTSFYDVRPQQTKRKKPPAKKLILEPEMKSVLLSTGKGFGAEQDGVKDLAAPEGQMLPVKEQLLEPSPSPAGDPQPNSLLEELMKEEKDWMHREQGTEKPAGDDPQLKEHNACSGGRKSPSSCSTLDQSEGEDTSRGSSQLSAVEFTAAPNTKAEDDDAWDLITCFCLKPFAGRPMIECNECATWIHLSCAKIRKSNVPEVFICQRCRDAKQEIRRSNRARTVPRKRFSPTTVFLNWVLFYLHIWLLWDHSWGESVGQPLSLSSPQAHPCASPLMESLGPKSALCFYSYFVL
ncbi:PHF13 protein, partial [Amazona guildingii]|nr:PHF13 protein [Amazona guildingii]